MFLPGPIEPTTAEGWEVLGCCIVVLYFLWTAFVLYACIRTGFREPLATSTLARTALAGIIGFGAYLALRRWVDY